MAFLFVGRTKEDAHCGKMIKKGKYLHRDDISMPTSAVRPSLPNNLDL